MVSKDTTTFLLLYCSAAVAVAIAGMIHLVLGPGNFRFNVDQGTLFVVGGIAQMFWIIPMVRRWGKQNLVFNWNSRNRCILCNMADNEISR